MVDVAGPPVASFHAAELVLGFLPPGALEFGVFPVLDGSRGTDGLDSFSIYRFFVHSDSTNTGTFFPKVSKQHLGTNLFRRARECHFA